MKRKSTARKKSTIEERISAAQNRIKLLEAQKQIRDIRAGFKKKA